MSQRIDKLISFKISLWIFGEVKFLFFPFSHSENTGSSSPQDFKSYLKLESWSFLCPHRENTWRVKYCKHEWIFIRNALFWLYISIKLFFIISRTYYVDFGIPVTLWIACWWQFEDSCWWKPLSTLLACFQLEYPVLMKKFSTLISFTMLWLSAFLQMIQYALSSALPYCSQVCLLYQVGKKFTLLFQTISWDLKSFLLDLFSIFSWKQSIRFENCSLIF